MSELLLRYRGPRHPDRTAALELAEIPVPGIRLEFEVTPSTDGGVEALLEGEADIAEIPLSALTTSIARGDERLSGLPVFLSRRLPQSFLWVARDSRLVRADELNDLTVGWAPGAAVAAAWSRYLIETSGATANFVPGVMGGTMAATLDRPGATGVRIPAAVVDGNLDALASPYPVPLGEGGNALRPLLESAGEAAREWVRKVGFLPMTSVLGVRADALDGAASLASSLMDGFQAAGEAGTKRLRSLAVPAAAVPWSADDLAEIDDLLEGRLFAYGLAPNRGALQAFTDHLHAIGSSPRRVSPEELFLPAASEWASG